MSDTDGASLLHNRIKELEFADRYDHENYSLLLYTPNPEDFEDCDDDEAYDKHDQKAISEMLEKYKEKKDEFQISLLQKYDSSLEQFRIALKVTLSQGFVDNLCSIIPNPKVTIGGSLWPKEDESIDSSYEICCISNFTNVELPLKAGESIYETQLDEPINRICANSENKYELNYSVLLEWSDVYLTPLLQHVRSTLLETLWNDKLFMDCTIVASNKAETRCHRSILAAHSDVLHSMFTSGLKESETNRIEMDDMSHEGVTNLLAYMYGRGLKDEEFTDQVALELLQAAHKYNITYLEQTLVNIICRNPTNWFSKEGMLAFYFCSLNISAHQVICEKMLSNMKKKPKQFQATSYYKAMMEKNPKEVAELAVKLLEEN